MKRFLINYQFLGVMILAFILPMILCSSKTTSPSETNGFYSKSAEFGSGTGKVTVYKGEGNTVFVTESGNIAVIK